MLLALALGSVQIVLPHALNLGDLALAWIWHRVQLFGLLPVTQRSIDMVLRQHLSTTSRKPSLHLNLGERRRLFKCQSIFILK